MSYPALTPTSRTFDPGDFPIKKYRSQSGVETRILYGNKQTGMKLTLGYENITDAQAETFLDHYTEMQGTFQDFTLPSGSKTGWTGNSDAIDAATDNKWRYENPPNVQQVRPGISSVTVSLVGVL